MRRSIAVLVVLLAACGGGDDEEAAPATTAATETTATTASGSPCDAVVDAGAAAVAFAEGLTGSAAGGIVAHPVALPLAAPTRHASFVVAGNVNSEVLVWTVDDLEEPGFVMPVNESAITLSLWLADATSGPIDEERDGVAATDEATLVAQCV